MPQLRVTMRDGEEALVDARVGLTIMEAIRDFGVEGEFGVCGGGCSCATCHVLVDPSWVRLTGDLGPFEEDLLESASGRAPNSRLSCQIIMTDALDGICVTVGPVEEYLPQTP